MTARRLTVQTLLFFAGFMVAISGCVWPMASMDPIRGEGQDLKYRSGTPILASRGTQADVVIAPKSGPTGQHAVRPRLAFLVSLRNKLDHPVEVSERSVTATLDGVPAAVLRAVDLEAEIRNDAAWARVANGVNASLAMMAATSAGETTHTGRVGNVTFEGSSHDKGAVMRAQRLVASDTEANDTAIATRERAALANLYQAFQRNTVESGEVYGGVVLVERPERGPCSSWDPIACNIVLTIKIEDEAHDFAFTEFQSSQ